ncbi:MAG: CRISPR-associated endonuclease Cas2 [Chloroherpetonaceae bacterium]
MYIIIVYDAAPKRGVKLLKFLRQHLFWVQNSVFEGEITEVGYEKIKGGISKIIKKEEDSIIIYTFDSKSYTEREIIGIEKNTTDTFI